MSLSFTMEGWSEVVNTGRVPPWVAQAELYGPVKALLSNHLKNDATKEANVIHASGWVNLGTLRCTRVTVGDSQGVHTAVARGW